MLSYLHYTVHFFLVRHFIDFFTFSARVRLRVCARSLHRMLISLIHRVIKMLLILVTSYYRAQVYTVRVHTHTVQPANENTRTILP